MFCCMLVGRGCGDGRKEELRTGVRVGLGRTGGEVRTASEGEAPFWRDTGEGVFATGLAADGICLNGECLDWAVS